MRTSVLLAIALALATLAVPADGAPRADEREPIERGNIVVKFPPT